MSVTINGTNGLTFNDNTTQATSPFAGGLGFRNRIINGDMRIDQRNAGASVGTASGSSVYTLDRWLAFYTATSKYTIQQNAGSVTPPVGFTNYLGITSSSAYSVGASDYFLISQKVEGFNIADLGWGTANAATVTVSFWVRSSLTGTFGGSISNNAINRTYAFTYTISAANTWEQKTVTIAGDTTGTWLTNNSTGLVLYFNLGTGSTYTGTANTWSGNLYFAPTGATSVVGTNGATFYITGVQLEKGSTATSFDYRPYGTELLLCQRYFYKSFEPNTAPANGATTYAISTCAAYNASNFYTAAIFTYPAQMRATPTVAFYGAFGATGTWDIYKGSWTAFTAISSNSSSTNLSLSGASTGMTAWQSYLIAGNFTASSEL